MKALFGDSPVLVLAATFSLALAACAPAAALSPTSAPRKPAATAVPKAEAPAAAAKPAASPKADTKAAEWEQTVAAAKREGKLAIYGPSGDDAGNALTQGFREKYPEIELDYSGLGGGPVVTKILTERAAGLYLPDIYIAGAPGAIASLIPGEALEPMQPFLVGPSVEPSKWMGGKLDFSDLGGKYNLNFVGSAQPPIVYNPDLVSVSDLKSHVDLLDAKWKGKVAMHDPRTQGPGNGLARFFYVHPDLGKDFIQRLASTEVVFTRDERQHLDWAARGQHPIALGPSQTTAAELRGRGVKLEYVDPASLKEGGYISSGSGSLSVLNKAPHPNAAKVYLNWLLSKEGQTAWTTKTLTVSRRLDTPRDHLPAYSVPKEGVRYLEASKEEHLKLVDEIQEFLRTVLGS